jgi:hypothetical protein
MLRGRVCGIFDFGILGIVTIHCDILETANESWRFKNPTWGSRGSPCGLRTQHHFIVALSRSNFTASLVHGY